MKLSLALAASVAFAGLGVVTPTYAAVVTIIPDKCAGLTGTSGPGCFFEGNIDSPATIVSAQTQYNALRDPDIVLNLLGTWSAESGSGFGSVTFGDSSETFGTWSAPDFTIDYLAVKAGTKSILYTVTDNLWDTDGLVNESGNNKGERKELSHLTFFGTRGTTGAVPEPASWAMMIGGFGMVGGSMRYRRRSSAAATAA